MKQTESPTQICKKRKKHSKKKIEALRTADDETSRQIVNTWDQRTEYKEQIKNIERQIEEIRSERIKQIKNLINAYKAIPGHDREKVRKMDDLLNRLSAVGTTKSRVYTRAERREMFDGG